MEKRAKLAKSMAAIGLFAPLGALALGMGLVGVSWKEQVDRAVRPLRDKGLSLQELDLQTEGRRCSMKDFEERALSGG